MLAIGTGATLAVGNTSRKGKAIAFGTGVLSWVSMLGFGGLTYLMMDAVRSSDTGILMALTLGGCVNVGSLWLIGWGGDKWSSLADDEAYKAKTEEDNPFSW